MHTPGPWEVGIHEDTKEVGIVSPKGGIARVFHDQGVVAFTIQEALDNARLIAAAPDLLFALEAIVADDTYTAADRQRAKAAIAKARAA